MTGSAAYVRDRYGVPAKRGMRVIADGTPGVITGFHGARLRIRLDGQTRPGTWHPTWNIEYPDRQEGSPR